MSKTQAAGDPKRKAKDPKARAMSAPGGCRCGAVRFEIDVPAVWAWHDHSRAGRDAHGGAYATYVGSWKSRFRLIEGEDEITCWEDPQTGATRHFCGQCGTPVFYVRKRAPKMVNIPRALFTTGVGREPRYHVAIEEAAPWEYDGTPLGPLKGYPGIVWERPRKKKRDLGGMF